MHTQCVNVCDIYLCVCVRVHAHMNIGNTIVSGKWWYSRAHATLVYHLSSIYAEFYCYVTFVKPSPLQLPPCYEVDFNMSVLADDNGTADERALVAEMALQNVSDVKLLEAVNGGLSSEGVRMGHTGWRTGGQPQDVSRPKWGFP